MLVELNEQYPFDRVCKLILDFGQSNAIPTHDLPPAFMGQHGPDLWVSPLDQHPNKRAHRIAADSLSPFVESLLKPELVARTRMAARGMRGISKSRLR
jgi:hypothetical protein